MTSVDPAIIKLIKKKFETKHEFIPGKTIIKLIEPAFGPDEIIESLDSLLTTNVTMGSKVKRFEGLFSKYLKSGFASMVNSGSSANLIALSSLTNPWFSQRIKKNTEVITPAVTWATTVYPYKQSQSKTKIC